MTAIMGTVAVFGVYLSIGVFRYSGRIAESWIVLGCVGGFLGGWGLLLWLRNGAKARPEIPEDKLPPNGP